MSNARSRSSALNNPKGIIETLNKFCMRGEYEMNHYQLDLFDLSEKSSRSL